MVNSKAIRRSIRGKNSKAKFTRPEGAGNFDNMDDFNFADSVNTNTGTIQHVPTNETDIVNKKYVDSQAAAAVLPPIGSIIGWAKSLTGVPALPDGWVEANGQSLSDAASPLNGQTIPDLNGAENEQRFLRGCETSGSTGGSDEHCHWLGSDGGMDCGCHSHDVEVESDLDNVFCADTDNEEQYECFSLCCHSHCGCTTDDGCHCHELCGCTESCTEIPSYYQVVWIMRVK